ncbi:MAG TPA: VOC family protein [Frankiaceae bacterium]|jgi:predicted enzyme related to lactoylglutathione lyase|nr:VOC family protein [Frankiaceae bacterium]
MHVNNVTLDAADAASLARFYAALLDREVVWEEGPWVVVGPKHPGEPNLVFQQVSDPTPGKAKAHLDLHCDDVDAATEKALGLGATRGEDVAEHGMSWRVMADPEGNAFCLAARG